MIDTFYTSNKNDDEKENGNDDFIATVVTVALLTVVTIAACFIRDLSLVLAVGGGTFSTAVTAIFPTIMYKSLSAKEEGPVVDVNAAAGNGENNKQTDPGNKINDAVLAEVLMWVCIGIGASGVFLALR